MPRKISPVELKNEINKEEAIWAAGLFEGEGCITISKDLSKNGSRYYYWPMLVMQSTDKDVVERFHRAVGGLGAVCMPSLDNRGNRKQSWKWSAAGINRVEFILNLFMPWLNGRRKLRAEEVIRLARESLKPVRPPNCSIEGCTRPSQLLNGMCRIHYKTVVWNDANRERVNENQRRYNETHREEIRQRSREAYQRKKQQAKQD